jgi:hypothetical protein
VAGQQVMYDRSQMKTVLICGSAGIPDALRELVGRGSTSLAERSPAELNGAPRIDADRIVFWTATADPRLFELAERYARAEAAERREALVFIGGDASAVPRSTALAPNEIFVWPGDEDRLKMAFLTGA